MEPRPIQRDLMMATEIIALSHREEDDPFQASWHPTIRVKYTFKVNSKPVWNEML